MQFEFIHRYGCLAPRTKGVSDVPHSRGRWESFACSRSWVYSNAKWSSHIPWSVFHSSLLCCCSNVLFWQELYTHIMRNTSSLIASLLYGKRFPYYKNSQAEEYTKAIKLANEVNDTARFPPVEIMPWITYIPRWLAPVRLSRMRRRRVTDDRTPLVDGPLWPYEGCAQRPLRFTFKWVRSCSQNGIWYWLLYRENAGAPGRIRFITKRHFVRSTHPNYILQKLIRDSRFLGATLMDTGAETSAAFLQAFVLALLSYPECQKHIQNEIDTVIGSVRMPNFADFEQLPYLQAFINEVSVW